MLNERILPLVSIIIPCYNCEKYIDTAIESILNQTYANIEILIIDDCSSDSSYGIIYQRSLLNPRIKVMKHEENKGIVSTLNELVLRAEGKYIARMDADDVSLPKRIEAQVLYLEAHRDVTVCGTGFCFISEEGKKIKKNINPVTYEENLFFSQFYSTVCHPSAMFRSEIYKNNLYDEEYQFSEDYELWTRLLKRELYKIENLSEILFLYRISNTQICNVHRDRQALNGAKIYEEYWKQENEYIEYHKEIFFLMKDYKLNSQMKEYIKNVLKKAKKYNYKYSYQVYDKLFYFFRQKKHYGCIIKLCMSIRGIYYILNKIIWKLMG